MQVPYSQIEINDILGCMNRDKNEMDEMMKVKTFDDMKA